ncbi:hypothetical protein B0H10DRAFT_1952682 [Mycena sp. CBHHK59/15]|nr:hypothetical protein B0H10DRAFT_1952682 [Mycena sp. CBHHK59/15]
MSRFKRSKMVTLGMPLLDAEQGMLWKHFYPLSGYLLTQELLLRHNKMEWGKKCIMQFIIQSFRTQTRRHTPNRMGNQIAVHPGVAPKNTHTQNPAKTSGRGLRGLLLVWKVVCIRDLVSKAEVEAGGGGGEGGGGAHDGSIGYGINKRGSLAASGDVKAVNLAAADDEDGVFLCSGQISFLPFADHDGLQESVVWWNPKSSKRRSEVFLAAEKYIEAYGQKNCIQARAWAPPEGLGGAQDILKSKPDPTLTTLVGSDQSSISPAWLLRIPRLPQVVELQVTKLLQDVQFKTCTGAQEKRKAIFQTHHPRHRAYHHHLNILVLQLLG